MYVGKWERQPVHAVATPVAVFVATDGAATAGDERSTMAILICASDAAAGILIARFFRPTYTRCGAGTWWMHTRRTVRARRASTVNGRTSATGSEEHSYQGGALPLL